MIPCTSRHNCGLCTTSACTDYCPQRSDISPGVPGRDTLWSTEYVAGFTTKLKLMTAYPYGYGVSLRREYSVKPL